MSPDWYARLLRRLHSILAIEPLPGLRQLRQELDAEIRALEELVPPANSMEAETRRRATDLVVERWMAHVRRTGRLP